MKRTGNLWTSLTSWDNLVEASRRAALGKKTRADVAAFLCGLESELAGLRHELLAGAYQPGPYRVFLIREPKPREISAAPFRDRVVHHAFTQVVEPLFERRFSPCSYACRTGLGTHRAVAEIRRAIQTHPGGFALHCDVRKYFASIHHQILQRALRRVIKCLPTIALADRILTGYSTSGVGLPLGNQTSQFFANVYLNSLDHQIVRTVRPAAYARYVDDLILVDPDKQRLQDAHAAIGSAMRQLGLSLHPRKSRIYRNVEGVTFLGWRIFPDRTRLVRENVVRFRRTLRRMAEEWAQQTAGAGCAGLDWETIHQSVQSWIGHAQHGDTWRLREQIFDCASFMPRPGRRDG